MGWKLLVLCFVGIAAAAAPNGGWKPGTSYTYKIQGRTFSGHQEGDQYSGIETKGKLTVIVRSNAVLLAKIHSFQYARIHTNLPDGPLSHIPESQLKYEDVPMSAAPFEIHLRNGVVQKIEVRKDTPQWQVNIIKSIVSQINLDTQGENLIKSKYNLLPEENSSSGVYKTMEDSVAGKYETLYELNELPPVHYQEKPWLVPHPNLKGTGKIIEISKSRNFTRGEGHMGYHYGFDSAEDLKVFSNKIGQFVSRSSVSNTVISGTLSRYTIQSVSSTNVISVTPTANKDQLIMVTSRYQLTLEQVASEPEPHELAHDQHITLNSLTYSYARPSSQKSSAMKHESSESSEEDNVSGSSEDPSSNEELDRHPLTEALDWYPLTQAPPANLGPFDQDENMDKDLQTQNVAEIVKRYAREIAQELEKPEDIQNHRTLSKFIAMVALMRTFDEKDLKEITNQLAPAQGNQYDGQWMVHLDALANSGSGPSLLVLRQLMKEKRVKGENAAQLLAQASRSVRQPTFEYMRTFYELTKDNVHDKSEASLHKTAVLVFADLVGKVYSDKDNSDDSYPTNAYGSFATSRGQKFVVEEYIPYLRKQLDQAIEKDDSEKAQVYIHALGYVADPTILIAFEKYLEGKKEASQFLRTQMVAALERMSQVHPEVAQPVLYRIYRNSGENQDVRVLAIQYLTNTEISADMFQEMAAFTNIDSNEYVNAAVAHIIRNIADLEPTHEHRDLQANAQSAVHLLDRADNPLFLSYNSHYDGICSPIFSFAGLYRTIGSEDSFYEKAQSYNFRVNEAGIDRKVFSLRYMISSLEALAQTLTEQLNEQAPAASSKWAGESIRRELKIENDQIEKAEANFHVELAGIKNLFTFNPQMAEQLVDVVKEVEERLSKGEDFHYSKLIQLKEMAMSMPTETGFSFYYSQHTPFLINIEGSVSGEAQPKVAQGENLRAPKQVKLASKVKIVFAGKMEKTVGFVVPFERQYYYAAYDKNMQVYLPLKVQVKGDMEENKYELELETDSAQKRIPVLHYDIKPYTSRMDIATNTETRHEVNAPSEPQINGIFGQKSTGMAWRVRLSSSKRHLNMNWYNSLNEHIHNTEIDIDFDTELSENKKIQVQLAAHSHRDWAKSQQSQKSQDNLKDLYELPEDHEDGHDQLYQQARAGIQNAQIYMVEANVTFQGQHEIKYYAVATSSDSPVDEDARILVHAHRRDSAHKENNYQAALVIESRMAKTNEIDPSYALKHNPKSDVSIKLAFGGPYATATKVITKVDLDRSERRTRHLEKSPMNQECTRQSAKKNLQLPACLEVIYEAHLFDQIRVQMRSENVGPQLQNLTEHLKEHIAYVFYKNRESNTVDATGSGGDHKVINVNFDEDLEEVSVAIHSMDKEVQYNDIRIPEWIQPIVTVSPDVSAVGRWLRWATGTSAPQPSCSVDQSAVNTFDDKTYDMKLKDDWTVMFVYAPNQVQHRHNKGQGSQMKQSEEYVVLTRAKPAKLIGKDHRDVKITLRSEETKQQHVEIDLTTSTLGKLKASVNGRNIPISSEELTSINEGTIEMYLLPNDELKVKVKDAFEMVYDGNRARLDMAHNNKFQNKIRGLCGTADGHDYTDFKGPRNCIYDDVDKFVDAYQPFKKQHPGQSPKSSCNVRKIIYADVISDQDVGRSERNAHSNHGTQFQTKYAKVGKKICFTEKPQPACKAGSKSKHHNEKLVSALCLPRNDRSIELMRKVDNGENLDFSNTNDQMRKVTMKVPKDCTRN